jgi:predicted nucleotidyltransferase
LEWLQSPIVYYQDDDFIERLRECARAFFNPRACMYHYLSMAKNNYTDHLDKEYVRIKKYFYALRPLLACNFIEQTRKVPPIEFDALVNARDLDDILLFEIGQLLTRKRSGEELDLEPRNLVLNEFIESEINRFNTVANDLEVGQTKDLEPLNQLFRDTLNESWP